MTTAYERDPARTLVVGATGTTGRLVAEALARRGADVVAAARRGTPTRFDWADHDTHAAALAGVDTAYLVPPPGSTSPASVLVPFLRRAADAGLRRVVVLGAVSVEAGEPGIGEVYRPLADLVPEWAVLRPSWFMQNFVGDHQQARSLRADGVLRTATRDGRVPFVDAADIAEVAATVLLAAEPVDSELIVTGPAALTYDEVAAVLAEATGRPVRHERVTVQQLRDDVFADLPRDFADVLAGMDTRIATGTWSAVTDTVERVTGRPARSFAQFVTAHLDEFARS